MRSFKVSIISVLIAVFAATAAFGQATGGAVTGTVNDANSAAVPNASVKLTDKLRGNSYTVQTTSRGSFTFPNVPVGDYTISAELANFSTSKSEVRVTLNQTSTVDFTLQPAGVSGVVDVITAAEPLVQVDTSQIGKSFETRKVQDLPIGADPNNLALLAPNVVPRASGVVGGGSVLSGATVGGVRPRGNTFNIDGVDNNDASVTGPSTAVILDSISEFTLLQNNFNAEFGAGAGGQFNTITKSGTNTFNGSAFTYIDSQRFNSRNTLEDGRDKDFAKQVRYGGTLGGPILKDKLFFFGAYERTFADAASAPGRFFAPTLAGLNQIAAIPGVSPFVVNLLRDNLTLAATPTAQATADFGTVRGVSGIPFGEVILPVPASFSGNTFQVNMDYNPTEKDQLRFRFTYDRQRAEQPGGGALKFNNLVAFDSRLFSTNWVRTINSNLINDARISFRTSPVTFPLKDESLSAFPNIVVNSLNFDLGPNSNLPQGTPTDESYQIYDGLTYLTGNHTFKFGAEMRRLIFTSQFLPRGRGEYIYSDLDALITDAAPDFQNIRGVGSDRFVGNRKQFFFFAQDDWRIKPNLTLNLGVRYEYSDLPRDAALQELNQIASVPGVIEFNVPKTDKNNFAPRVGFAWSPDLDSRVGRFLFGKSGESSIRGNFAIAHFVNFQNLLLLNLPPQFQQEVQNGGSATGFLQNGGTPATPQPAVTQADARAATASYIVDQDTPYSIATSLSIQRQLRQNLGIELRYLFTNVKKLPVQVRLNASRVNDDDLVIPTFFSTPSLGSLAGLPTVGDIIFGSPTALVGDLEQYGFGGAVTAFPNIGESKYHGASVSLNQRFSKGLAFTAAYTFSKTIDNSTNELNSSALNPRRPQNGFNIADEMSLSALDVPHRLVVSFNYDLPFFNNHDNKYVRSALGGWSVNGIFQAQTGQPITILSGIDSNFNLDAAGDRAIFNPNGRPGTTSRVCPVNANGQLLGTTGDLFDPGFVVTNPADCGLGFYGPLNAVAYVAVDPNGQFVETGYGARSNLGRNTFRTQGYNTTDLVLLKNTKFGTDGRYNLQIGAEITDVFNQRVRTISGVGATTAAFGTAGNASFNDYSIGAFPGRTVTMRAKFIF